MRNKPENMGGDIMLPSTLHSTGEIQQPNETKATKNLITNMLSVATPKQLLSPEETEQGYRINQLYGSDVSKQSSNISTPLDPIKGFTNDEYIKSLVSNNNI